MSEAIAKTRRGMRDIMVELVEQFEFEDAEDIKFTVSTIITNASERIKRIRQAQEVEIEQKGEVLQITINADEHFGKLLGTLPKSPQ